LKKSNGPSNSETGGKAPLIEELREKFILLKEESILLSAPNDGLNCANDEVSLTESSARVENGNVSFIGDVVSAFASQTSLLTTLNPIRAAASLVPTVHVVAAFASQAPLTTMLNPIRTAAFLTEFFDIAPSTVRGPKKSGRPPPLGFEGQYCATSLTPPKKSGEKQASKWN
jgi:hypothetical protein